MKRRHFIMTALCAGLTKPALAYDSVFHTRSGLALDGYDTVSYFAASGPVRGRRDIAVMWKGAIWRFANLTHLEFFEANPWGFAPRYGAYCAYAMSKGNLMPGDPRAWHLVDGHLYVTASMQIRSIWRKDIASNILKADAQWPDVLRRS